MGRQSPALVESAAGNLPEGSVINCHDSRGTVWALVLFGRKRMTTIPDNQAWMRENPALRNLILNTSNCSFTLKGC